MFVFSLTTAGISSFLTDRLLKNDINDITLKDVKSDLENIHKENMSLKEEVRDLKDEIHELKDLLNKKD
jgi:cell division protein FtsB